jgi:hypothetical protein
MTLDELLKAVPSEVEKATGRKLSTPYAEEMRREIGDRLKVGPLVGELMVPTHKSTIWIHEKPAGTYTINVVVNDPGEIPKPEAVQPTPAPPPKG